MQRVTAVIAANSIVWGVHNGTTFNMSVRRFELSLAYDAALATTTSEYQFIRWSAPSGTNLTGGTALGAVKRATTMNVSTIADARFSVAAALGVVGIVFEADPFYSVGSPRINGASGSVDITAYESQYESVIQLAPNEGLALRLGVASAIGDSIGGMIGWTER